MKKISVDVLTFRRLSIQRHISFMFHAFRYSNDTLIVGIILVLVLVVYWRVDDFFLQVNKLFFSEIVLQRVVKKIIAESALSPSGSRIQSSENRFFIVLELNQIDNLLILFKSIE